MGEKKDKKQGRVRHEDRRKKRISVAGRTEGGKGLTE